MEVTNKELDPHAQYTDYMNMMSNHWTPGATRLWNSYSVGERFQVEQIKLLRSLNGKMSFFVFLAVVSILISIFGGLLGMFR